jgi:hypothetical protein
MNGRVYDPLVSRFLSPDLFVQAPGNSQSFNRYAYVFNNPLSHTDPSGYIGIPRQWSESPVQEVDNSWFWMNHNLGNHGFGGGSGSGSSFGNSQTGYGLPGFGGNGTGVNGIYYDLVSGAYRYVSNPGRVVIGGFWLDVPLSEKVNEGLNGKLPGRWIIGGGIRSIYVNQGLGVGDDAAGGGGGVGQPGTWESLIPIWGSGRAAIDHFQSGNWGRGLLNTGIAISDVFLVKSIGTAIGKGAWKLGSHSWSATRSWLGKTGYAEAGQPVHHWAVSQATAKQYGLEAVTNQPWNLMTFPNQSLHLRAGHGMNFLDKPGYGAFGQIWYGTPIWPKAVVGSYGGRIVIE